MEETLLRIAMFALLIPAIVFHEVAHGRAALALGDPTAKNAGRLSLNPIKHIDLWGTILLPLLMVMMFGFGFGYAKPVPINPMYFRDRRKGMFLVGIAGPAANLVMAAAAALLFRAGGLFGGLFGVSGDLARTALYLFAMMNLALMFFNLIPLPPLDGSRVLPLFLSDRAMAGYAKFEMYGILIIFGLLFFAPRFLGFDLISEYFRWTLEPTLWLLTGVTP